MVCVCVSERKKSNSHRWFIWNLNGNKSLLIRTDQSSGLVAKIAPIKSHTDDFRSKMIVKLCSYQMTYTMTAPSNCKPQ